MKRGHMNPCLCDGEVRGAPVVGSCRREGEGSFGNGEFWVAKAAGSCESDQAAEVSGSQAEGWGLCPGGTGEPQSGEAASSSVGVEGASRAFGDGSGLERRDWRDGPGERREGKAGAGGRVKMANVGVWAKTGWIVGLPRWGAWALALCSV